MAKITDDFVGTEDTATVKSRLDDILGVWGYDTSGYSTWGDARTDINAALASFSGGALANNEVAASFITKLNALNDPISLLFAAGEQGAWFDPSPLTCFTDTGRTTPAAVGQAVAGMTDLSGGGKHATQSTLEARPILRQEATGEFYLEFDGVDDFMVTPTINLASTDKVSVFSGLRQTVDSHTIIFDPQGIGNFTQQGFRLISASFATPHRAFFNSRGATASASASSEVLAFPASSVISGLGQQTSGNSFARLRRNGVLEAESLTDQGGGDYANRSYRIGMRGDGTGGAFFIGNLYSLIVRGAATADATIERTERYIARKTAGVSIP
jgi:hypothetical protein